MFIYVESQIDSVPLERTLGPRLGFAFTEPGGGALWGRADTPTDTNVNLSPPTTTIGNWNTHTFWLISGQIGQTVKTFVEVLASVHLSLLLLTFSIMSYCWSWSFFSSLLKKMWIAEKTLLNVTMLLLSNPKAPNLEPLTGVLIPQLN